MQLNLVPHPVSLPTDPTMKVWVNVDHAGALGVVASTNIWFGIGAPATRFVVPQVVEEPKRAEGLWQTTCFEAFFRLPHDEAYREWNFAPSGNWAAYDFASRREGRTIPEVSDPYIRVEDNLTWWALGATIAVDAAVPWTVGLSVILEETEGTKSYWALTHPLADKPDFHDPAAFTARLP
ncbi:MAG TPA: hypothetical protein VGU01_13230 [Sphingomicrobium sp.]|nr:hypothetical protein [Sphingomicrobium sp.]